MSVTPEQVEDARQAADRAEQDSTEAHEAANAADAQARLARQDATTARTDATTARNTATAKENDAAAAEGRAAASQARCTAAQNNAQRAATEATNADAQAARVHEQNPNVCNPDTDAADEQAAAARERARAAAATAGQDCDQAQRDQAAAQTARTEANTARQDADVADQRATQKEDAARDAENHATDQRAKAIAAAMAATLKRQQADALAVELSKQGAPSPAPKPRAPATDDGSALAGAPPAQCGQPGVHSDTTANFTTGAKFGFFLIGGPNYEKVGGNLVEITVGNKITNVLAYEGVLVVGGKLEEVGGFESKLVLGGDRRWIAGARWERNVGLKAETVWTDVEETILAKQEQHVPTINGGSNPSEEIRVCPEVESKAVTLVEQHKAKLAELRQNVKVSLQKSQEQYTTVTQKINSYQDQVGKIQANIQTMLGKFANFKTQAEKYQMKSDAFIKFMVSGSAKFKAGRFKGSAKEKYHLVCDAMARFQGEVKWN